MLVLFPPHPRLISTTGCTTTTACNTMLLVLVLVLVLLLLLLLLLLLPLIIILPLINTNNFRPSLTLSLLLLPPLLLCSVLLPLLHRRRRRCTLRPPRLRLLLRCRQPIVPCQLNLLVTLRTLRSPRPISNNKIIIPAIVITITRILVPPPSNSNLSNLNNNCPPIPLPTSESSLPVVASPKSPTMPMCSLGIISSAPSWS